MVEDGRKENDNEVSAGGTLKMFIVVGICVCALISGKSSMSASRRRSTAQTHIQLTRSSGCLTFPHTHTPFSSASTFLTFPVGAFGLTKGKKGSSEIRALEMQVGLLLSPDGQGGHWQGNVSQM